MAQSVITAQEKKRGRVYTAKQKKFLKLLADNDFKDAKDCATRAGYKTGQWQVISALKEDIKEISEALLLGSAPEAAMTLATLVSSETPVPNAATKLQAAKEVLDRVGVIKEERSTVSHQVEGGLFFLPMKQETDIEGEYESIESE